MDPMLEAALDFDDDTDEAHENGDQTRTILMNDDTSAAAFVFVSTFKQCTRCRH